MNVNKCSVMTLLHSCKWLNYSQYLTSSKSILYISMLAQTLTFTIVVISTDTIISKKSYERKWISHAVSCLNLDESLCHN